MAEEIVTLSARNYADLVRSQTRHDAFVKALFASAKVYSEGNTLYFSDDVIRIFLNAYYPDNYKAFTDDLVRSRDAKKGE